MSDLVRSAMELMVRQHKDGFESEVTARLRQLEASVNNLNRTMAQIAVERPA
ncbi:MAG TPA: hypothetical protein VKE70_38170 [Candidatus Solibacter sp.]|nr:hypothetical protein [Candidatus Solibacter sp.]